MSGITPRLQMRGISKKFGATVALDNVDFTVYPGEIHALVGENGAGKSTLMKILSGAYTPDSGEMLLDGKRYLPRNPMDGRQKGIGMIYQELSLVPHLTVEENVMLGMEPNHFGFIKWNEVRQRTLDAISVYDHPEIKPDIPVSQLSVSAQQLVEIGRALAIGSRVLVFDEPTSSLSQQDIQLLFKVIRSLKQKGLAIIYISHFLEEVQEIADNVTVLRDGSVTGTRSVDMMNLDEIVQMMVGREVDELYPHSERVTGEPILEVENLAGVVKPKSASFILHRGEVLGIAGLVGAGRTELIRTIFGLAPVREGNIRVGLITGHQSPVKRWLQGVGLLSENRKQEGLALNLTISDNITMTKLKGFGPFNLVFPKNQHQSAMKWVELLDIRCNEPKQIVAELSGGNQQKIALARLLQHDVDVLLLDEPTRGIDVAAKAKIYQVINELATGNEKEGRLPKAILIISSYIPELLGVCDRISVMSKGILSNTRNVSDVDEHRIMLAATGQSEL